ncbi:MAG: lipid-A-disaccharide synthase [candidate division Zixibacteria bacterium]|nr:lipid-A-disaccharide synthase [candidate division Zixibacteria bacterium]
MNEPLLFISAGDPSGDTACARMIDSLREQKPDMSFFGLGGHRLAERGQDQLADPADLAVLGFWEVAKRFFYFRHLMQRCVAEIEQRHPKAVLLVDYPGFNLRLAKRIKQLGIPIIYYISPQVWAWGKRRLGQIRKYIDQMLVILPFEEKFYRDHGVTCKFVGHYLLEDIPADYISSPVPDRKQIALLPGSRSQEIERMLPVMLDAAARLNREYGCQSKVAALSGVFDYESVCAAYSGSGVEVIYDDPRKTVFESELVLTASGTATLETGIIGRPMVVVYKTGSLTYQIAKRLVKLDKIALVNLVLGKKVVPELIQSEATGEKMATELSRYWSDRDFCERTEAELKRVPSLLGGTSASQRVAEVLAEYL